MTDERHSPRSGPASSATRSARARRPTELVEYFADDAVYHNIPVEPAVGREAILGLLNMFVTPAERVEFRVRNIVANGDTVLTERVDVFQLPNADIELPVMGTFEVRDGKIAAWRDYFDLNQYMSQLQGAVRE